VVRPRDSLRRHLEHRPRHEAVGAHVCAATVARGHEAPALVVAHLPLDEAQVERQILEHEGRSIQDSTAILSYLDDRFPERSLVANSESIRRQALEVEEYLDEDLGFHLRRFLYATFLAHRRQVTAFFLQGRSWAWRPLFAAMFPLLRAQMQRQMQLTPANAAASERRLLGALDLSAAALLSLLTWPEKHDFRWPAPEDLAPPLAGFRRAVAGRPCFAWALGLYRDYH
jgi:glutathione S-transferase